MMNDKPYYEVTQGAVLRTWVLGQMLRGAGYGAALVIGIGLFLGVIFAVSCLLPAESKEAPAPMGSLTAVTATVA